MKLLTLGALTLSTTGDVRYLASLPADAVVNAEGATIGQGFVLDQRYRVGLALDGEGWSVRTKWDLFSGQLAGDPWDIPGEIDARDRGEIGVLDADSFVPREALVEGMVGPARFTGGLQTSHWGLGMLANDGEHEPTFGRADFGDRVLRARIATKPAGKDATWAMVAAFDRVVEDETASWALGQAAYQGVLAIRGDTKDRHGGLYGVYRDQTEADGERVTRVVILDGYGETSGETEALRWGVGGELAGISGETSRSRSYTSPEGLRVASAGATGYASVATKDGRHGAKLRAGWASGDGNPDDGVTRDFAFDRDFDAGMVLFDEYAGAIEAAGYEELSDPEHSGQTPDGADALVTEGAFRRATFVQPVLEARPLSWLGARVGVMGAWSTAPIAQPFYSYRAGGTPTNQLGEPTTGRWLGAEIDWALAAEAPAGWKLRPALTLQGGYACPSVDNGNPERDWLTLHTATARLRW